MDFHAPCGIVLYILSILDYERDLKKSTHRLEEGLQTYGCVFM